MSLESKDWYRRFFEGITLDLWDAACGPELTGLECDLIEEVFELETGAQLLDAPCGLGRHAVEFASRGHRVTGADLSREALKRARARASAQGVSIETWQGDLTEMPWEGEFEGVFCLGNSFGYFERNLTKRFLDRVSSALVKEGRFLMDTGVAAESILPNLDERNWVEFDDILMLIENDYQVEYSRLKTTFSFIRNGKREVREAFHYVFSVSEILSFLEGAGLKPLQLFSSHDLKPFSVGDDELFVLAEKA